MGPRVDKIMTAVHDAARDMMKQQEVRPAARAARWRA